MDILLGMIAAASVFGLLFVSHLLDRERAKLKERVDDLECRFRWHADYVYDKLFDAGIIPLESPAPAEIDDETA